jgi:Ca2+/H+ antiporter
MARTARQAALQPRLRKLIGTVLMIVLVLVWALGAMALAQGRVTALPGYLQFLAYVVLGLGWIVPAGLLIRWMLKDDVRPETL